MILASKSSVNINKHYVFLMLNGIRFFNIRLTDLQSRRVRGDKGGIYPPNNMTYSPLLTWLQIYLKIYSGVLVYKVVKCMHSVSFR